MLNKSKGIVINYVKYKETSIIVKIYTEEFGIQTYIENGVRSSRSKNKIALFQPLTLLDLVIYHKEGKDIQRIAEIKCNHPFHEIPYQIAKSSIAMFITEILVKTLKEEMANKQLFAFVNDSIVWLDEAQDHFQNFHLQFLLKLSAYLGFLPETAQEMADELALHGLTIQDKSVVIAIESLLVSEYDRPPLLTLTQRNTILAITLQWFHLHIESMGEIKSLAVLKETLH